MITCFRHYNILVKSRSRMNTLSLWRPLKRTREKKALYLSVNVFRSQECSLGTFLFLLLETGPSCYVVIPASRRFSRLQCKGTAFISQLFIKTLNRVRSRELNPRPPDVKSSALPTQLILRGLIIPGSRSLPCYSFNATGSPFYDFILYFLKWSWSVCHFSQQS